MDIVTQEDINMFSQMFSKLSNIIVQASEVGQRLPVLQGQIEQLTNDCEAVRRRNQELDEELFNVRNQRDIAQQEARQAQAEASSRLAVIETTEAKYQEQVNISTRYLTELETTRKERDDYGFRNMELQDQLDKANATLAKFKELLGNVFPEPSSVPVQDHTPTVEAVPVTVSEPQPTTKRIYRYDENGNSYNQAYDHERYVNNRPHVWDVVRNDYYVEVAA